MATNSSAAPSARHGLDDLALGKYLAEKNAIPGITLPVKSTKIGYGQSNPTYFVDDAALVSLSETATPTQAVHAR